jgi:predicted homoserine dehydrogenase-like protein
MDLLRQQQMMMKLVAAVETYYSFLRQHHLDSTAIPVAIATICCWQHPALGQQ